MKDHIEPAPDRINRRVFPCLKAVTLIQIMRRLPEVKDLIAILYRCQKGRYAVRDQTDVEGYVQREIEGRRGTAVAFPY